MSRLFFTAIVVTICFAVASATAKQAEHHEHLAYDCDVEVGKGKEDHGRAIHVHTRRGEFACIEACMRKKKTNDEIVAMTSLSHSTRVGCYCLTHLQGINRTATDYRTCLFVKPGEAKPTMRGLTTPPLTFPPHKTCVHTGGFTQMGCYNMTAQGRLILNYRWEIEWDKQSLYQFACNFVSHCAIVAKKMKVEYFSTHFWGECWEVDPSKGVPGQTHGCVYADGEFGTTCVGKGYKDECLGTTNHYVYKAHD